MASIIKLTDKRRSLPWRAKVKGRVKMFQRYGDAKQWAAAQELKEVPPAELRKHTVREIVEKYLREKTPLKGCAANETLVLNKFLRRKDFADLSLDKISEDDGQRYLTIRSKETWRDKPITPRTIRREVNSIQHVFEVARREWGFKGLINPFRIEIKGSTFRRRPRFHDGELEQIKERFQYCLGRNKFYVPLAFYIATETGMRLQEIFNLTWHDLDFKKRLIDIRKSKTGPRTIVMPAPIGAMLISEQIRLMGTLEYNPDKCIFPMTKQAFKQSWGHVVRSANLREQLTFHDLRHVAASSFDQAGLTKPERDLMLGHSNKDIDSVYVNPDLKRIRDKLERDGFRGKTLDERMAESEQTAEGQAKKQRMEQWFTIWSDILKTGKPTPFPLQLLSPQIAALRKNYKAEQQQQKQKSKSLPEAARLTNKEYFARLMQNELEERAKTRKLTTKELAQLERFKETGIRWQVRREAKQLVNSDLEPRLHPYTVEEWELIQNTVQQRKDREREQLAKAQVEQG